MHDWTKVRWRWQRAVMSDKRLSDPAKLLAVHLNQFSNHRTAFCNPKTDRLADAAGKSVRAVQRALAELIEYGWITVSRLRGSKAEPEFQFHFSPGFERTNASEKVVQMNEIQPRSGDRTGVGRVATSDESGDTCGKSDDRSVAIPHTPYIAKPNYNQKARAPAAPPVNTIRVLVLPGTSAEASWNHWQAKRGAKALEFIGFLCSDGQAKGWGMPALYPPAPDDAIGTRLAERHLAHMQLPHEERRHA